MAAQQIEVENKEALGTITPPNGSVGKLIEEIDHFRNMERTFATQVKDLMRFSSTLMLTGRIADDYANYTERAKFLTLHHRLEAQDVQRNKQRVIVRKLDAANISGI